MNQVAMSGQLIEKQPLAYTPAGLPLLKAQLAHQSQQVEAGATREVRLQMEVLAIGEIANRLSRVPEGGPIRIKGFLAAKSLKYPRPVLHITAFDTYEPD